MLKVAVGTALLLGGCEATRSDLGGRGGGGPPGASASCVPQLELTQRGVSDPVVIDLFVAQACADRSVIEVRLGGTSDVVTLRGGLGQAILDCAGRDRTVVGRFLEAALAEQAPVTRSVDCGHTPPPPPRPPALDTPPALAAYRCEAGELRGVSADATPPIVCLGPGLTAPDEAAQAVPCGSCNPACAGELPAGGRCWRVAPEVGPRGAYGVALRAQATTAPRAKVCVADAWGRSQVRSVELSAVGFVGAWVSPSRIDLGPEHRSGEGRACAQVNDPDGRPLGGVPLRFGSTWGSVFINPLATSDDRGVACVDLLVTGAVSPTAQVTVKVAEQCGGGGIPLALAPVRVVSNPASPATSELSCAPDALPGFDPLKEVSAQCSLRLADRFGQPVLAPVFVGFAAEAGEVAPAEVVAVDGVARMLLRGDGSLPLDVPPGPGEPSVVGEDGVTLNPRDGFVTVTAWWRGEEALADEAAAPGRGDSFVDLGDVFVDADDDGIWSEGEWRLDEAGPWAPGDQRFSADAVVWTEARLTYTEAASARASLASLRGCQSADPTCAIELGDRPCRVALPLHDARLNPPAGAWRPTLTLNGLPVPLATVGGVRWEERRTSGVGEGAFQRGIGFEFSGPVELVAHLSAHDLAPGTAPLTLSIAYDAAPGGLALQTVGTADACVLP